MVAVDNLSLQLYTVRGKLEEDFDATLARIAEIGYTKVEPFGVVEMADKLAEALPKYGLSAPTTHAGLLREDDFGPTFEVARKLGIGTVIDPFVDPAKWQSADDIKATAEALNKAAAQAADHGITIGYHNPTSSWRTRSTGCTAWRSWPATWPTTSFSRWTPTGPPSAVPTCPRCSAGSVTG